MLRTLKAVAQASTMLAIGIVVMGFFIFYLFPMTALAITKLKLFLGLVTQLQLQWENLLTFP